MYEAMFIFPDSLKDDALDAAVDKVKGEIERCGGRVESTTRLGRRAFVRPLHKQTAGQYIVVTFKMEGDKIRSFQSRLKLNEDIFRVQIVRQGEKPAEAKADAKAGV